MLTLYDFRRHIRYEKAGPKDTIRLFMLIQQKISHQHFSISPTNEIRWKKSIEII